MPVIPEFLEAHKRVLETEFLYPYLVYFMALSLGTFYEFLFIFFFFHLGVVFLLTIAHMKDNKKLKVIGKAGNIFFTIAAFINIFASDMYFSDFSIST